MQKEHTEKNGWLMYALPLVILTCFAVAYLPVFQKLIDRWSSADNSYCYLIVPLFAYLLWDKRGAQGKGIGQRAKGKEDRGQRTEDRDRMSDVRKNDLNYPNVPNDPNHLNALNDPNATEGFRFGEFSWSLWALAPITLSVFLIIVGELGSVRALMFMGIWGCVAGLCVLLYGKRTRHLAFPLLILIFIIPLPPFVNQVLTFKLKMAASNLAVWMLRAVGISVLLEGNIIDIGIQRLEVADACSGLRYFMPMILMALLVAYFFVKGRWRWAVLLFLIVPLSVFINAVRIWISALLNAGGHPELAENLFHDFSGWLMFMIAGGFLVAVALLLKRVGERYAVGGKRLEVGGKAGYADGGKRLEVGGEDRKQHPQTSSEAILQPNATEGVAPQTSSEAILKPNATESESTNSTNKTNKTNKTNLTSLKKPILITIALCLLFAVSGWALKQIPSSGHLPQRTSFDHFPMNIGDWQGQREYISEEILNSLWADDYVKAQFYKPGSPNMIYLLIPFYEYQATNHTAHAPQACILGGGFSLVRSKAHPVRVAPDREIEIMTMVLEKGDTRMLGSYFFLQKGRVITSPWMNKYYLIWDGITKQRTDGALVRAEMTVAPGQSMEAAHAELEGFIAKLWPILPRYIPR